MPTIEKLYKAIVWSKGPNEPGMRVSVMATDPIQARALLEQQYGVGTVFFVRNDDEAKSRR